MRKLILGLMASALVAIAAPAAQAFTNCHSVPNWCPPPPGYGHHHTVPEPGTLGLLVLGTAASIGMIRRKKKR